MKIFRDFDETEAVVMHLIVSGNCEGFTLESINQPEDVWMLNEDGTKACHAIRKSGYESTVSILIRQGSELTGRRFTRVGGTLFHSVFRATKAAMDHIESLVEEK